MNTIYKLKDNINKDELLKFGFFYIPTTEIMIKIVPQEIDSEPVTFLLKSYYENQQWKEKIYSKFKNQIKKTTGIAYDKQGKIIMSEKFKAMICSWRIELDPADGGWVGFTSMDGFDQNVFYAKSILDKFCYEDIKLLKDNDLIEEIEVN